MTGSTRAPTRARLRTKTGCLTCRKRRKKCNEVHPSCGECSFASRKCEWPASQDLLDRRFASHHDSRHRPRSEKGTPSPTLKSVALAKPVRQVQLAEYSSHEALERQPSYHLASLGRLQAESGAAFIVISRDTSVVLSRHFVERYYDLLLLPACHHSFYDTWLTEIEALMDSCKSLYYSALACSAAHIQLQSHTEADRGISPITYYTNATKELSGMIEHATRPEGDNGLLTSVILMYLHGCMGLGTYSDIPIHVNAAIRILTMRLLRNGGKISHPFDRTAVESVLYQIFLVSTGLWSEPAGTVYALNTDFWSQADNLLERSTFFPGKSTSFNSPVLGVPTSLFRLALTLRQQFGSGAPADEDVMSQTKGEVEDWEAALLADEFAVVERSPGGEDDDMAAEEAQEICKDAERLYAIILSLLYEQLSNRDVSEGPPLPDSKAWQVKKALRILERRKDDTAWSRCYIGNWPVYTIGFFINGVKEQEIVRHDMQRRWEEIGFAQIARFRNDLECVWVRRASCQST